MADPRSTPIRRDYATCSNYTTTVPYRTASNAIGVFFLPTDTGQGKRGRRINDAKKTRIRGLPRYPPGIIIFIAILIESGKEECVHLIARPQSSRFATRNYVLSYVSYPMCDEHLTIKKKTSSRGIRSGAHSIPRVRLSGKYHPSFFRIERYALTSPVSLRQTRGERSCACNSQRSVNEYSTYESARRGKKRIEWNRLGVWPVVDFFHSTGGFLQWLSNGERERRGRDTIEMGERDSHVPLLSVIIVHTIELYPNARVSTERKKMCARKYFDRGKEKRAQLLRFTQ